MHEETGEIRRYEDIPKEEIGKWSEPFHVGEIVEFKGVRMEIVRIKKMRKELHLHFAGPGHNVLQPEGPKIAMRKKE